MMSKSDVDSLNEKRRSQKGSSVKDAIKRAKQLLRNVKADGAVSYTHLTLPTICSV